MSSLPNPLVPLAATATSRQIAEDTFETTLQLAGPINFLPGQYIGLQLKTDIPNDPKGRRRDLSIVSLPNADKIVVAMRDSTSPYKQALLHTGTPLQVEIRGPHGFFTLPETADNPIRAIAGGIGITPFVCMARWIEQTGSSQRLDILAIDTSAQRIAYRDELTRIANACPSVTYQTHIGRIDSATQLKHLMPNINPNDWAYLSGPPNMTFAVRELVRALGVSPLAIKQEEFTGYIGANG